MFHYVIKVSPFSMSVNLLLERPSKNNLTKTLQIFWVTLGIDYNTLHISLFLNVTYVKRTYSISKKIDVC